MISVIICSINQLFLSRIKINIAETIGVVHEIIVIENKTNKGICEVYNLGGEKAIFPYLCFVHEDVEFYTDNWGTNILNHFNEDELIGLIGIAGGDTKGVVPSGWFTSFKSKEMNLLQYSINEKKEAKHIYISANEGYKSRKEVVTIDGVFLCTRKEIFNHLKFDGTNLTGFHGYDMDYSLNILRMFKVVVIFDVLILHFSNGKLNNDWLKSSRVVANKWKKVLPVSVYNLSPAEFNRFHWQSLQEYLANLFRLNYGYAAIFYEYLYYSFTRYFKMRSFLSMGKYVVTTMYYKTRENNSASKVMEATADEIKYQH